MANTDALLKEIRERRTLAETEWSPILDEARTDRLCAAGKVWEALDPAAVQERKDAKRPMLAPDEIGQYLNQVVNDVRANPRAVKFAPTGNGANDQGAEFYQNRIREIEYRSHASRVAYPNAFDNAVTSSVGWVRINLKRVHMRTFDQEIWIEPVMNPDQVLPDPGAVWPDSRDLCWLFYVESFAKDEFARTFPKATITHFADFARIATGWIHGDRIHVAEYWRQEVRLRKLLAFRPVGAPDSTAQTALLDELTGGKLPVGMENVREETVEDTAVRMYLTNGVEILKEQDWPGKYIPFVSCFGKVLYVDLGSGSQRQILSLTRLARDPMMLYAYMTTCEAEAVGGIPRAQWVGYEGQFAKSTTWDKANREPVSRLEAKVTVAGAPPGAVLPLPQKQSWDPPLGNLEIAKEAARRAIQAAMGIMPLPTAAQRQNEKSGRALDRISSQSQRGSFHFVDHYDLMIERVGTIYEDLEDKVEDTVRDVPVRRPDDSSEIVRINDPSVEDSIFTKGDYRVTVSTGASSDSQRQEANEFVDAMVSNLPAIGQIIGPQKTPMVLAKAIKLKQLGPIGDEIIELLTPPQPTGKDGKPLPPEVAAMTAENQALKGQLEQAKALIQGKRADTQQEMAGKFAIAQMQEVAESHRHHEDNEVKLAVAAIQAKVDRIALFLEERARVGRDAHEALEDTKGRVHELRMMEHDEQRAREQAAAQADTGYDPGV